jgi:hypothetical protein
MMVIFLGGAWAGSCLWRMPPVRGLAVYGSLSRQVFGKPCPGRPVAGDTARAGSRTTDASGIRATHLRLARRAAIAELGAKAGLQDVTVNVTVDDVII